jgi:hypothetical protein
LYAAAILLEYAAVEQFTLFQESDGRGDANMAAFGKMPEIPGQPGRQKMFARFSQFFFRPVLSGIDFSRNAPESCTPVFSPLLTVPEPTSISLRLAGPLGVLAGGWRKRRA